MYDIQYTLSIRHLISSVIDVSKSPLGSWGTVSSELLKAPDTEVHLEDMSAKALKKLEYVFKVAEERDGPLNYETFRNVLQAVLGHRVCTIVMS